MKVMVDVDGVILDIHSHIEKTVREFADRSYSSKNILTYDLNRSLYEKLQYLMDKGLLTQAGVKHILGTHYISSDIRDMIYGEFTNPSVFKYSKLDDNCIGIIKDLMLNGVEIVFHTVSLSAEVKNIKKERIKTALEGCEGVYKFCDCDSACDKCLKDYDYVVEDCLETLVDFSKKDSDVKLCMVSKSYNSPLIYAEHEDLFKDDKIRIYADAQSALVDILCREFG